MIVQHHTASKLKIKTQTGIFLQFKVYVISCIPKIYRSQLHSVGWCSMLVLEFVQTLTLFFSKQCWYMLSSKYFILPWLPSYALSSRHVKYIFFQISKHRNSFYLIIFSDWYHLFYVLYFCKYWQMLWRHVPRSTSFLVKTRENGSFSLSLPKNIFLDMD